MGFTLFRGIIPVAAGGVNDLPLASQNAPGLYFSRDELQPMLKGGPHRPVGLAPVRQHTFRFFLRQRVSRVIRKLTVALVCVVLTHASAGAQSLKGSAASVERQAAVAQNHDFTYLKTPGQVRRFVKAGLLVRVSSNRNLELSSGVSFPYCRPEVKLFLDRLAGQYRAATGEKLVVTSLTRPISNQPRNASAKSVHPTGMAADIRRPRTRKARRWLERTLLTLEHRGVLEATREHRPPHYHVAVYPQPYEEYVQAKLNGNEDRAGIPDTYTVLPGDSLWGIARTMGTSVSSLKQANRMNSTRIYPGQKLQIPTGQ